MKFSIIVPVYNVDKYLKECLISIINQTYRDFEIIIVDDGSTDSSPDICDSFSKRYCNVKVIHKSNEGLVRARKTGLLECSGEYIINLDSDDFIDENLLRDLYDIICNYTPEMICFGLKYVYSSGEIERRLNKIETGLYSGKDLNKILNCYICDLDSRFFHQGLLYGIVVKVVKKELLLKAQLNVPDEITVGEDLAVTTKLLTLCNSVYVSEISGYYYRQVESSMTHEIKREAFKDLEILIDYLLQDNKVNNKLFYKQIEVYLVFRILNQIIQICRSNITHIEFVKYLKNNYNNELRRTIKCVSIKKLSIKDFIRIMFLKNQKFYVFWLYYHVIESRRRK